jgi:hypothetical protein
MTAPPEKRVQGLLMNKFSITILASSLLLCCIDSVVEAQTARAMIADTPIRAEANLGSPIIAKLREGSPVDVVDMQGDWYRVLVPNESGKARVGYVLARLIEIVNADGSSRSGQASASRAAPPAGQSPPTPPTLAQPTSQRDSATAREQALKAEVDALQAEVNGFQQPPRTAAPESRRDERRLPMPVRTFKGGLLDAITLYVDKPSSTRVVIRPFSATDADIVNGDRKEATKTMQADGPRILAERFVAKLKEFGPFTDVAVLDPQATPPMDALVIEGKFTELDPGSRAKRYLVGFGSGKSGTTVEGSVKAADGTLLATFEQRRIGVMGMGGGDSLGKLVSDTKSIGEDLAKFMSAWGKGGKLK